MEDIRTKVQTSTIITDFQRKVYLELLNVAEGKTITYGELARRIGCRSAQAVGQALHRNPFAPEVPCHRVIASDGSLGGYAFGVEQKAQLLQKEKENASKEELYRELYSKASALLKGETDLTACMANLCALIHSTFNFWWTGFYRVCGEELILGPFQGPVACIHIPFGNGVCGTSWKRQQTIIVPNVEQFPGHIACSSESRSEIVVPVRKDDTIIAVLDIDSRDLSTFTPTDQTHLESLLHLLP